MLSLTIDAQMLSEKNKFTKQDTIRGSITPERAWWDVTYYHLDIAVNPEKNTFQEKTTFNTKF